MPRNDSDVYSLPSGVIVTTGENILPSQHNPALLDFASDANAARPIVSGGTGAVTAPGARTNLGLVIGTNVQAYSANLQSLSGLTLASDKLVYATGASTLSLSDLTAAGRALLDDADAAAQLVTLGIDATAAELNVLDGATDHDTAAWEAGTATEPGAPSPADVAAAIAEQVEFLSGSYAASSEISFTLPSGHSFSHGLGSKPRQFGAKLVCTTADLNYDAGDEVELSGYSDAGAAVAASIWANATSVGVRLGNSYTIGNKTTSAFSAITATSWRVVLWAIK